MDKLKYFLVYRILIMSVISPDLNEIYRNLTGYKKILVRFYADRTETINANDVLRWTFPKEIMLMDTLMHYFEFTSTAAQTGTSTRRGTHFPRNSASKKPGTDVFYHQDSGTASQATSRGRHRILSLILSLYLSTVRCLKIL